MSTRQHRRQFLQATATFVAAMHAPLLHAQPAKAADALPRLRHLKLQSHKLVELRAFYHQTCNLPLATDASHGFSVTSGPSTLEFTTAPDGTQPFYHFAWNIPENQFLQAKAWLSKRTTLLRDSTNGKDEVFFAAWNAHAVYFRDPAGNIGELIAHHTLKNAATTPFSEQSLLSICEIGLVTDDTKTVSSSLAGKLDWPRSGSELVFVGDPMGYLIVAPIGRPWLPDRIQKSAIAPAEIQVNQKLTSPIVWPKQHYHITGT